MNILQVNDRMNLQGGTEEYVPYISRKLAARGHQVSILFEEGLPAGRQGRLYQQLGRSSNDLVKSDVQFFKLPLGDLTRLAGLIKKLKPDVANLHNVQNPYTIEKINRLVPAIRYIHDHRVVCPGFSKFYLSTESACPLPFSPRCALNAYVKKCATRRPLKLLERMKAKPFELEVNRALPRILVASEYMKGELVKNRFSEKKIVVMPDPIEMPAEDFETEYGDFILFVGRLTVEKGLKYLLQAMIKVSSEIKLRVVGDGPERLEDQELTSSLGLSSRVTFTGWMPYQKVLELYARCRFLVFPSVWPEPYGRTGPEAMMFEKPVIGFSVGAVTEWLKDGENGSLVEPRDVEGLAEKMSRLWDDSDLARELGQRGKEFIVRHTDSANYIRKLERLFDTMRV